MSTESYIRKMKKTISEIYKVEQEMEEERRRAELRECYEIAERIRKEEENYE